MLENLTIRDYNASDKPGLLKILQLNIPDFFAESELADLEEYLDQYLEVYFVLEMSGKIIGGGGINFDGNGETAKISWDFIDPTFQGKGIGKLLLQHRIKRIQAMSSIKNIQVRTSQVAYQFYEKNGFVLQEIVKDYWAEGFDLYDMRYR